MQSHSGIGRKWRRFKRDFGVAIFVGLVVLVAVAVVGLLTYMLTSPSWRVRW
jgi:hypothetical protein